MTSAAAHVIRASTFDRPGCIRGLKDAPDLFAETAERVADTLAEQLGKADTIDRRGLTQAVTDLKVWTAGVGGVVFAALSAIKLFG